MSIVKWFDSVQVNENSLGAREYDLKQGNLSPFCPTQPRPFAQAAEASG